MIGAHVDRIHFASDWRNLPALVPAPGGAVICAGDRRLPPGRIDGARGGCSAPAMCSSRMRRSSRGG